MCRLTVCCAAGRTQNAVRCAQVLGDEPEYSSCHGRVIATLDYVWYSETPHLPSATGVGQAGSPLGNAVGSAERISVSPDSLPHASSSATGPQDNQNGDSQPARGDGCALLVMGCKVLRLAEKGQGCTPNHFKASAVLRIQCPALSAKGQCRDKPA